MSNPFSINRGLLTAEQFNNYEDYYSSSHISFAHHSAAQQTPTYYFCEINFNQTPSSTMQCVASYFDHKNFKSLKNHTKSNKVKPLELISKYINSSNDAFCKPDSIKNFFNYLKKERVAYSMYNNVIYLLNNCLINHEKYGIEYDHLIYEAIKNLPKTIKTPSITRSTLGDKLFSHRHSAQEEKALWSSFNATLYFAFDVINNYQSTLIEHFSKSTEAFELLTSTINKCNKNKWTFERTSKLASINSIYRDMLRDIYIRNDELSLFPLISSNSNRNILESYLNTFKIKEPTTLLEYVSLFYNETEDRVQRSRWFSDDKKKNIKVNNTLISKWLHPDLIRGYPSKIELSIFFSLLAKHQLQKSLLVKLSLNHIDQNENLGIIILGEVKERSGKGRGQVVEFSKANERKEYEIAKSFVDKITKFYKETNTAHEKTFCSLFTIREFTYFYFLEDFYPIYPKSIPKEAHYFLKTFILQKEVVGKSKLTKWGKKKTLQLNWGNLTQTQKVVFGFDYKIYKSERFNMPKAEQPIESSIEACKRAHSLEVDINTYEARIQNPILLEADHTAGRQVADSMTEDAHTLLKKMREISVSEAEEMLGVKRPSETLNESGFAEFIKLSGKDVNDYLGIKDKEEILIIKHPLVLAFLKQKINQIDIYIESLRRDQSSPYQEKSNKVNEIEGLRIVLATLANNFNEVEHVKSDEILAEYDLPLCDPII
ncbi:hypothetical protein AB6C51_17945 [Vibrio splendidus]